MIDQFKFNKDIFNIAEVIPKRPGALKGAFNQSEFDVGECLGNSYKFAKITGCLMVEGFLVTEYLSKADWDVVGHVWNQYNGKHFDLTVGLIDETDVKTHYYYPLKAYRSGDALIQQSQKVRGKMEVAFHTYVEDEEQDARLYINSIK